MYFHFDGEVPVENLEAAISPLISLLQREGLERVTEFSISFLGWRGDARCQIVDDQGWIQSLRLDPAFAARDQGVTLTLPPGISIRDRPDDLEWSPFAAMAGRDD